VKPSAIRTSTGKRPYAFLLLAILVSILLTLPQIAKANFYREWSKDITPPQGSYLYMLGKYILPGNPYVITNASGGWPQFSVDRILLQSCMDSNGPRIDSNNKRTCLTGDVNDVDNDPWVEIGIGKFQYNDRYPREEGSQAYPGTICSPTVYTYCGNCPAGAGKPLQVFAKPINFVNSLKLWWVPASTPVGPATTGTYFFALNDQVVRSVEGIRQGTRIYTGGEITNQGHEWGVNHDLLNQFAYRESNTSYPEWYLWLGPTTTAPLANEPPHAHKKFRSQQL